MISNMSGNVRKSVVSSFFLPSPNLSNYFRMPTCMYQSGIGWHHVKLCFRYFFRQSTWLGMTRCYILTHPTRQRAWQESGEHQSLYPAPKPLSLLLYYYLLLLLASWAIYLYCCPSSSRDVSCNPSTCSS